MFTLEEIVRDSVNDEVANKRESFEALFKGVKPTILESWMMLSDYDFYSKVSDRIRKVKYFKRNDAEIKKAVDDIEEYVELKGKALETYINTDEGQELLDELFYMPVARLALAHVIGLVRFTGEAFVITTCYVARVAGKFASELSRAAINTARFAKEDGSNYKHEISKAWDRCRAKGIKDEIKDRC